MSDIKIIETGSGGDLVLVGNDIEMVSGVQNMPYLGLFGGNERQSTKTFKEGEEKFDFWANDLFLSQNKKAQFNSSLERILKKLALNSSSRILIEDSIKNDLEFMKEFSVVEVDTLIRSTDRIEIKIKIKQSGDIGFNFFNFIWDVTEAKVVAAVPIVSTSGFSSAFSPAFG